MLELAILAIASARAGQKLVEGASKVAVEDGVDDGIQRRVAVTQPEYDGEHGLRHLQSGQHRRYQSQNSYATPAFTGRVHDTREIQNTVVFTDVTNDTRETHEHGPGSLVLCPH